MAVARRLGDGPQLVYRQLRRRIIEQLLRPGERLPEAALAVEFGVSRTIIRAGLERLVAEGLAERVNNRLARVSSLDPEQVADLLDIRIGIESLVMVRLSDKLSAEVTRSLREHVAREEQVSSLRRPEAVRLAGEFHVLLAEATGSASLSRCVSDLVSRSSLVPAGHAMPQSSSCAVREHLSLLDLLHRGDGPAAIRAMDDHLRGVARRAGVDRQLGVARVVTNVYANDPRQEICNYADLACYRDRYRGEAPSSIL